MIEENVTSAGTIVAAVLEGAGFYAHGQILDTFQKFFDAGGILIFVVSAAVGLLLTVLYGGYRPALALIIGPSLFYSLIGYRVPVEPPVKQLGSGPITDVSKGIRGTLDKNDTSTKALPPAQISWFLSLTARLGSSLSKTATDLILDKEKEEELLFLTQKGALNALLNAEPSRSELQSMLTFSLLNDCAPMLSGIYHLSNWEFSDAHEARLEELVRAGPDNPVPQNALNQLSNRRIYWGRFIESGSAKKVKLSRPMRDFMARETSIFANGSGGAAGIDYASRYGKLHPGEPAKFISDELPQLVLTCGQTMDVFADAALVQGKWIEQFVEGGTLEQSLNDTPENREILCRTISEKLFGVPATSPCQLGTVSALFIMRNLFSATALNQASQTAINRSITTDTSISDRCRKLDDAEGDLDDFCATLDVTQPTPMLRDISDKNSIQAENLKYSIISYALNIPYYQGILLYALAAVFPFWSMLVLIPGRAGAFLYLPLAWLWLKSWDVGFALVLVLDQLLWNLLPSPRLLTAGYNSYADLPTLLRGLAGVDLGGDILAHYYFVGMSLLAVPVLTGYAFLRGRSDALSVIYRAPGIAASFDKGSFNQLELNEDRNYRSVFETTGLRNNTPAALNGTVSSTEGARPAMATSPTAATGSLTSGTTAPGPVSFGPGSTGSLGTGSLSTGSTFRGLLGTQPQDPPPSGGRS